MNASFDSAAATFLCTMIFQPVVNFLQTTFCAALRKLPELGDLVFWQVKYTCNTIELPYVWIPLFPVPEGCLQVVNCMGRRPFQVHRVTDAYEHSALV
jgi:hypothetical protein